MNDTIQETLNMLLVDLEENGMDYGVISHADCAAAYQCFERVKKGAEALEKLMLIQELLKEEQE